MQRGDRILLREAHLHELLHLARVRVRVRVRVGVGVRVRVRVRVRRESAHAWQPAAIPHPGRCTRLILGKRGPPSACTRPMYE